MRTKVLQSDGEKGILLTAMTEEQEDYNAFGKWDAVGAAAMLGLFPAVLNFIFNDHDIPGTISLLSVSGGAALVVYLLGFIVPEKPLGRVVNIIGCVLTAIFFVLAYFMWADAIERDFPTTPEITDEAK